MSSPWSNWDSKKPMVPFRDNVMQTYNPGRLEMREIQPFNALMEIVDYERGMRAAVYILEDTDTGWRYPLQFAAMFDLVTKTKVEHGQTEFLKWQAVKRGSNYSIKPVL